MLSNWLTYFIGGTVGFFLSPFIVRHLGNSAYGVWVLLVSLTGYLGFLDLGIRGAVTRYIAKFHAEADHEQARRTIGSACGMFLIAGAVAVAVALVCAFLLVPHFQIPAEYLRASQIVVVITGITVSVSLVSGIFGGVIAGLQRFDVMNAIALTGVLLRSAVIFVALSRGGGLVTLASIQLGTTAVELTLGLILSRRLYPEARAGAGRISRQHASLILSFGIFALLLQLSNYLIFYTDALVIGALLPVSMVTFFAIGGNLTIYARDLVGGVSRTMTPLASKVEVEAGDDELRNITLKAGRFCSLVMMPIFLTFLVRGRAFIGLWMGDSYAELSGHVLEILSIPWLFGAGTSVAASVILGIGQHKRVVPFAIAEAVSNLVLSLLLIRPFGIVGVAWGTAIPNLAISLLFWPWYIRRKLGASFREYSASLWIRPFLSSLPFAVCLYAVQRTWEPRSLLVFFLQVIATLPVTFAGFWIVGGTAEDRRLIANSALAVRDRLSRRG